MEENRSLAESAETEAAPPVEVSFSFVGRWNRLVSTTNWEKGRIISQWRQALVAADAAAADYSDESWARLVGGVTGQHVGRLRRVYDRFGSVYQDYDHLYWSHFQAALDWPDAEMWLEGAVQSNWSVSQMRQTRWETLEGAVGQPVPDEEAAAVDLDEDFEPAVDQPPVAEQPGEEAPNASRAVADATDDATPAATPAEEATPDGDGAQIYADDEQATVEFVRPFENLADLPDDLADAFEAFKLAILRHKMDGWQEISCEDLLASLDALKQLALAES